MQESPQRKSKKKSFAETFSAQKENKNLNKINRYSENFKYKNEGFDLEKNIKKLTISDLNFIQNGKKLTKEANQFTCISPVKQNKQKSFNDLLMESEKHPASKYLILNIDKNEDDIHYLVAFSLKKIFKYIL